MKAFVSLLLSFSVCLFAKESILLGTGEIDGTYYPTGQFMCKLINRYKTQTNTRCVVEATDGSVANIQAIATKTFNFAISQSDTIYQAVHGIKRFDAKPVKNLRTVMSIYPELLTFVASKASGIKHITDIKNKRINIGNPNSGSEFTTLELFSQYQLKKSDLALWGSLKIADTADALKDAYIDGYFFMVGHPAPNIKDAAESLPIRLIPLKGAEVEALLEKQPYFQRASIGANLYEGVHKSIETFGVKAVLITHKDVSKELVYHFVKTILENFEEFKNSHPVYKNITKQSLLESLFAPQHEGAKQYFQEVGLL